MSYKFCAEGAILVTFIFASYFFNFSYSNSPAQSGCTNIGHNCTVHNQCCTGLCNYGNGTSLHVCLNCKRNNDSCSGDGQCCSNKCEKTPAGSPYYAVCMCSPTVGRCLRDEDCCKGFCIVANTYYGFCACLGYGAECKSNGECCNKLCNGGQCSCKELNIPCSNNDECCSLKCTKSRCACAPNGNNCTKIGDCCNKYCKTSIKGGIQTNTCQYKPMFTYCDSWSECLSRYCGGGTLCQIIQGGSIYRKLCRKSCRCYIDAPCTPSSWFCCSGYCGSNGRCFCKQELDVCEKHFDCCSGYCSKNATRPKCVGQPRKEPDWDFVSQFDF